MGEEEEEEEEGYQQGTCGVQENGVKNKQTNREIARTRMNDELILAHLTMQHTCIYLSTGHVLILCIRPKLLP